MIDVNIQHEMDQNVVRWTITSKEHPSMTCGIVVLVDMNQPDEFIEDVFTIANSLGKIMMEASEALRHKVMGV